LVGIFNLNLVLANCGEILMKKIRMLEDKELLNSVTGGVTASKTPGLKQLVRQIEAFINKLIKKR
jgi:hypothetical protein